MSGNQPWTAGRPPSECAVTDCGRISSKVHLNEADFPEPHDFRPERFMEARGYPGTFGHSAFGWGRRICPGMHLGSSSVSINIARILWAFDVKPAKDRVGKDIDVDM